MNAVMQAQKKHLPLVAIVTLVVIAGVSGSLYYYQYYTPHGTTCAVNVHRVFFMTAIIQEDYGFNVTRAAIYNETSAALPTVANSTAPPDMTGVGLENVTQSSPKTIQANVGDTITIYMFSISSSNPRQYAPNPPASGLGHGFDVDNYQISPLRLAEYGTWGSMTFTFEGSGTFRCAHQCSPDHGTMTGSLSVGGPCG